MHEEERHTRTSGSPVAFFTDVLTDCGETPKAWAASEIRPRTVLAVRGGMKQIREVGVSSLLHRASVAGPGKAPEQSAIMVRMITDRCPDQLKHPSELWTRPAVETLLQREVEVKVSVWTVGYYLKAVGTHAAEAAAARLRARSQGCQEVARGRISPDQEPRQAGRPL